MSEVAGYDPATGEAEGSVQGRILNAYNELLERGEEEKAAELRRANAFEQKALWRGIKDFDPKHNAANNTQRLTIKMAYDGLLEVSEESEDGDLAEKAREEAEALREYGNLGKQHKHAHELIEEFGLEVA